MKQCPISESKSVQKQTFITPIASGNLKRTLKPSLDTILVHYAPLKHQLRWILDISTAYFFMEKKHLSKHNVYLKVLCKNKFLPHKRNKAKSSKKSKS